MLAEGIKFTQKSVENMRREQILLFHIGKLKWRGTNYDGSQGPYIPREWILTIFERKEKKINSKYGLGTYSHMF